jgi:hypothetical protein
MRQVEMSNKKAINFIKTLSGVVIIIGIAIASAGILSPLDKIIAITLSNLLLIVYLGLLIGYLIIKKYS